MNHTDVYRVEALLELAARFPGLCTVREIARRRHIPEAFLARLLAAMAREGLVTTVRGPAGGVRLARPPDSISLAGVLATAASEARGGPAVRWLEERLAEAQRQALGSIDLAGLAHEDSEAHAVLSFDI